MAPLLYSGSNSIHWFSSNMNIVCVQNQAYLILYCLVSKPTRLVLDTVRTIVYGKLQLSATQFGSESTIQFALTLISKIKKSKCIRNETVDSLSPLKSINKARKWPLTINIVGASMLLTSIQISFPHLHTTSITCCDASVCISVWL